MRVRIGLDTYGQPQVDVTAAPKDYNPDLAEDLCQWAHLLWGWVNEDVDVTEGKP